MFNPLDKIKPEVKRLSAYTLNAPETRIKINQNENPYDLPATLKAEVLARLALRPWSRYPTFVPTEFLQLLANFAGWQADGVLAGNGSNELIQALLTVTVGPGVRVLICEPTFTLYRLLIEVLGGEVISVPLNENLQFDGQQILETALIKRADLVIICSPNNPTGSRLADEELQQILTEFPGLVVIDEAYHEFSQQTVVPFLHSADNLVVLRTFSKAMALAGLRIGYLLSSPTLALEIAKAKLPYNLNFFSMEAATVAIEHYDSHLKPIIDTLIKERERLFQRLNNIDGLRPIPSTANFIATETELPPAQLLKQLLDVEILARDISRYPMLDRFVRFSVGTPAENDELIEHLQRIMRA